MKKRRTSWKNHDFLNLLLKSGSPVTGTVLRPKHKSSIYS
jgi:hypothetical protein